MIQIHIRHYTFSISAPYQAGTVLTAGEAQALNALRAENVRNNVSRAVERAEQQAGGVLGAAALAKLELQVAFYDREYRFMPRATRRRTGALEAEVRAVAAEQAEEQARGQGRGLSESELVEAITELSKNPNVQEEARRRLAEREAVAQQGVEDLGL